MTCSCRLMTVEETLLKRGHYSPAKDDRDILFCPLHEAASQLLEALKAAYDHLEYCNYGDTWESECAKGDGLPEKIEAAIVRADVVKSEKKA